MPTSYEVQLADALAWFRKDTAGHELTVLHDDGLYRHLRFKHPDRGLFWFELVTWPGHLSITGDFGGAYTFRRLDDMFAFFRGNRIDPTYWGEKLADRDQKHTRYDEDLLIEYVKDTVVEAIKDGSAPRGIGKAIREEILDHDLSDERDARDLIDRFEFGVAWKATCSCGVSSKVDGQAAGWVWEMRHRAALNGSHVVKTVQTAGWTFRDTWEWNCQSYTGRFLWACNAIRWGIEQYDATRVLVEAGAAAP